ncbi:MAG TPA: ABC transporter permease [Acidimicrobiaceae bacterium]|nr:ABC transporter permease [Actinomycetota bacterium]MDG2120552.1 ABC transporter permease [Actinomycetota bacterium]HAN07424.1 ABC transporter permease [Acidimicrobiaceae bacterium]
MTSRRRGFLWVLVVVLIALILSFYSINSGQTTAVLAGTVRAATLLVLGAICGMICERSGIVNIGIEGQFLMSAFSAFTVTSLTGSLALGVFAGIATGLVLGWCLAAMAVGLKVDQIIAGTVINIAAIGLTSFFYDRSRSLGVGKYSPIELGSLADIPLIGRVLFSRPLLTYVTICLIVLVHIALFRSVWGMRTRAIGEHPGAADTVGIKVLRLRYFNATLAGGFAGFGGAYLALEAVGAFSRSMSGGRGFLALAVMIFGRRTPYGAYAAALFFGFATALQNQFQLNSTFDIPTQFVGMLPYVVTIVVVALSGLFGSMRDPAALGQTYEKS